MTNTCSSRRAWLKSTTALGFSALTIGGDVTRALCAVREAVLDARNHAQFLAHDPGYSFSTVC